MIWTKDRFYWKNLLYLSRARDDLRCVQSGQNEDVYQCKTCFALIRFRLKDLHKQTGQWIRIKPFEHEKLAVAYPAGVYQELQMEAMGMRTETGAELYRCRICASYWWKENEEWIRADDEMIESAS